MCSHATDMLCHLSLVEKAIMLCVNARVAWRSSLILRGRFRRSSSPRCAGTIAESDDIQAMPVGQNSLDGDGELMCCQCNGTMSGYNSAGNQSRDSLEASLGLTLGTMIGLRTSSDVKHGDVCFVLSARFGLSKVLEVLSDWLET